MDVHASVGRSTTQRTSVYSQRSEARVRLVTVMVTLNAELCRVFDAAPDGEPARTRRHRRLTTDVFNIRGNVLANQRGSTAKHFEVVEYGT